MPESREDAKRKGSFSYAGGSSLRPAILLDAEPPSLCSTFQIPGMDRTLLQDGAWERGQQRDHETGWRDLSLEKVMQGALLF